MKQENQGLVDQKSALDKALLEKESCRVQIKAAEVAIQDAKAQLNRRDDLEEEIRQLQAEQAEAKAENPRLKVEMEELKGRIDQLKDEIGRAHV